MVRGASDYHQRIFSDDTLLGEDNVVTELYVAPGAGGDIWREIGPVPAGRFWKIRHISALDSTSAITRITTLTNLGAAPHLIHRCLNPAAEYLCEWNGLIWVDEGWSVVCIFTGTVAGDMLEFYVNGVEVVKR